MCTDGTPIVGTWTDNDGNGLYDLVSCPAGYERQTDSLDTQLCHKCLSPGQYIIDPNNDVCQNCPPGLTCDGSSTKQTVVAGSEWVPDGGIYKLQSCPSGYSVFPASVDASNAAQQQCSPCLEGFECKDAPCVACTECQAGYYKTSVSTSPCMACPANTTSPSGSVSAAQCVCMGCVCGDGKRAGPEECDDGNSASADGCSSTCTVDYAFTCTGGSPTSADSCSSSCGDGKRASSEACDDGNSNAGDGCSDSCTVECGYTCAASAASDTCQSICGDSILASAEACDDGNTKAGDGCSADCLAEAGFECTSASCRLSTCRIIATPDETTPFAVKMAVSLPLSRADFTPDKQELFKTTLANVAGVSSADVEIVKIDTIPGRRLLGTFPSKALLRYFLSALYDTDICGYYQADSIRVDTSINAKVESFQK